MLERSKNNSKTTIIGGDTMMGQISSFMDSLHLSYKEVFELIPYRNLVMMQADKQREATGDIIIRKSSDELFGNNIKG